MAYYYEDYATIKPHVVGLQDYIPLNVCHHLAKLSGPIIYSKMHCVSQSACLGLHFPAKSDSVTLNQILNLGDKRHTNCSN